jgi:hypothetical protein
MMIIGVDYHPSFQQIAFLVEETGEYEERQLNHSEGEAERFYRDLHARGIHVRVGMEATGFSRWFERLLAELDFELWMGDPAEIKAKRVRKQKYDREDARLLLRLMRENNFPKIWMPSPENRDLRQLLWHRHRLVQMRTRIMNQLQSLAMNEGKRWKKKLWSAQGRTELEKLPLAPWASRRRREFTFNGPSRSGHSSCNSGKPTSRHWLQFRWAICGGAGRICGQLTRRGELRVTDHVGEIRTANRITLESSEMRNGEIPDPNLVPAIIGNTAGNKIHGRAEL